ncbi:MepB family protein [Flavobacterium soli]|uniref:MepB family protein n=1 Tax=Flavobacterium soli TaxID=344881 RepID=UPI0003F94F4C
MIPTETPLFADLKWIQQLVYDKCGLQLTHLQQNENPAYGACSFQLDGQVIEHRMSKITPTKTGQFVTVWKRNEKGITAPFDASDPLDFIIITSKTEDKIGQFIFPKAVLVSKGILSQNGKGGKRGIRVYPPWDTTTNKQAMATQSWQIQYFVNIEEGNTTGLSLMKQLFKSKK